jgi:hypothetical protein
MVKRRVRIEKRKVARMPAVSTEQLRQLASAAWTDMEALRAWGKEDFITIFIRYSRMASERAATVVRKEQE